MSSLTSSYFILFRFSLISSPPNYITPNSRVSPSGELISRSNLKTATKSRMAMRRSYSEIKGLKVEEVPQKLKPMFTMEYLKSSVSRGLDNYHAKYIETDSIAPLLHVCYGGMIFSYLVALPEERRHLEHQQHAKEHGGH